jgi:hypothetical protein
MIYINEVEVADILATNATANELVGEDKLYQTEEDLYEPMGDCTIDTDIDCFKEDVQDVFNWWYDYYWGVLFDNKEE